MRYRLPECGPSCAVAPAGVADPVCRPYVCRVRRATPAGYRDDLIQYKTHRVRAPAAGPRVCDHPEPVVYWPPADSARRPLGCYARPDPIPGGPVCAAGVAPRGSRRYRPPLLSRGPRGLGGNTSRKRKRPRAGAVVFWSSIPLPDTGRGRRCGRGRLRAVSIPGPASGRLCPREGPPAGSAGVCCPSGRAAPPRGLFGPRRRVPGPSDPAGRPLSWKTKTAPRGRRRLLSRGRFGAPVVVPP